MDPQAELNSFDLNNSWCNEYQKIREESLDIYDFSYDFARHPDNRFRNRYGDVSPFDFNRIILERDNIDYINASCVSHPISRRAYILAQGPLPVTCGHFWLMVWEQNSPAILMLSKLVEKNIIKCHKYYPSEEDGLYNEMIFDDVRLKVVFIGIIESNDHFITRLFKLQDLETEETKTIIQFHYISWPDFGVPASPEAFLQYLYAVRKSGVLDDPERQVVIHCSAGIGRSGTFCLVDICLHQLENGYEVDVLYELMQLRKYRMGLIQTPEQLRFSYLAIVEGSKAFLNADNQEDKENHNIESPKTLTTDQLKSMNKLENNADAFAPHLKSSSSEDEGYLRSDNCLSNGSQEEDASNLDYDFQGNHIDKNYAHPSYHRVQEMDSSNLGNNRDDDGCQGDDEDGGKDENGIDFETSGASISGVVRRRARDERVKKTLETIEKMRQKQKDAEKNQGRYGYGLYIAGTVGVAIALVAIALYRLG